jgi:HD-GYP domain-containing protein (c-di-GMP phosphodiesterase class II)
MSFKLLKNISKESTKNLLRKNKEKKKFVEIKKITKSSIDFSKNLTEQSVHCFTNSAEFSSFSAQNFAKSFKNISLSEKTRNEISEIILQKLKNRYSKIFTNHKKSFHFIILFSSNEAKMTKQKQQNRLNQNIQKMIQAMIREMMSEIIQQSVATTVNVTATTRSNVLSASDHSQMISKTTSKSRIDR